MAGRPMTGQLVTVFGGSGFLGRSIVKRLAEAGSRVRVAVRNPNSALFLKPMGSVGQIQIVQANIRHQGSVAAAVAGADAVINLVGVLYESGPQSFADIHSAGAAHVAAAATAAGVKRLVQVSALGANPQSDSAYARTKAAGESAAREAFPGVTILRPSVVFGPDDNFLNRFARLAKFTPALPLIGGGKTRFQPVYVGDVAEAVVTILLRPQTAGKTFELGGPRVYSFREILTYLLKEIGRERMLISLPFGLARFQAAFLGLLPKPLLTLDQVRLLAHDNVTSGETAGFAELGIQPTSLEVIAPTYLGRYRSKGEFAPLRAH
ncbi:complex I NDUFA9 subunit family protein [Govanella unica]|uniref:Complex I NDUFA9 subunit family protein n=1 Tax=Govanella unica TaxID=2975056 RepID=A0A9X3TWG3_9PROT|nr:complex I NDUFA9 subunit family protein [Govania unica]MDA5192985.1 complex I NDUFA9 subunit family protein [Govania unica]